MSATLYTILDHAWIYRLTQHIFSCGGAVVNKWVIRNLLDKIPAGEFVLDVGCGPSSRLSAFGLNPYGLDFSIPYIMEYKKGGRTGLVASAAAIPLQDKTFDSVWSIGMLHHLPTTTATECLEEFLRVCRDGGNIVIFDAVLPRLAWSRPLAWLIRRLDRGKHMRLQGELEALLPDRANWKTKRYTYALTGLEMLLCTYHKKGRTN